MPTHLYLSPHYDDAVLSCGGLIARQVAAGERVLVVTVCAGAAPEGTLSPFARFQHERWLAQFPGQDIHALRRAEDRAACARLGAEPIYLEELDCIYRRDAEGRWLYASEEALFGPLHPADATATLNATLEALLDRYEPGAIYAPLAAGNHVDHQRLRLLAQEWAVRGMPVHFYEDYPYIERVENLWRALNLPAPGAWLRQPQPLTSEQAGAKIEAIACYHSQLHVLFAGDMPGRVLAQLERAGRPELAEVCWRLLIP